MNIGKLTIQQNLEIRGWKGKGTETDPIIIDYLEDGDDRLRVDSLDKHVIIKDITLYDVYLEKCQNITIEGCKIFEIFLDNCNNLVVRDCFLFYVITHFTRGCTFENNRIHMDYDEIVAESKSIDEFGKKNELWIALAALLFSLLLVLL